MLNKKPDLNAIYKFNYQGYDVASLDSQISRMLFESKRVRNALMDTSSEYWNKIDDLKIPYPVDQLSEEIKSNCWPALRIFTSSDDIPLSLYCINPGEGVYQSFRSLTRLQGAICFFIIPYGFQSCFNLSKVKVDNDLSARERTHIPISDPETPGSASVVFFNPSCALIEYCIKSDVPAPDFMLMGVLGEVV